MNVHDGWVSRATRLATLHDSAMPGPLTPRHNARCTAMMIRPYKPRDSARSGSALLTAVCLADDRALPCTPEGYYTALRPLTGAAKYAWGA